MAGIKKKTAFFCQECGYEAAKWAGQCPACKAWNTMVEEPIRINPVKSAGGNAKGLSSGAYGFSLGGSNHSAVPVPLSSVKDAEETRFSTGMGELDRVLGGGAVAGSLVLVGGDPGIGKSTILLQTSCYMAKSGINKAAAEKLGCAVHCFMSDPDVAAEAKERGCTRAKVSMEKAARVAGSGIFAIGNAPTAQASGCGDRFNPDNVQ